MKTKYHILAVDDEQENLNLVRRLFRNGYEVHTALNAEEAVRVLEAHPIDLILCDQRMPGRTGVDLLEEVRTRWPRIARILVTAYADMDAAVAAINRGQVRRYISKPWDNEELATIIEQELRFSHLKAENERLALDLENRNRQLIAANWELESLDRMKSKLLANVSHELKTPLIAIKGYAEMLSTDRGGSIPPKAQKYVTGIRRSTERLEGLIQNLLQGARMASEAQTLVLTELDLAAWARAAARNLRPLAEEKGVTVEVTAERPVKITADASSVDRILQNLLSNAIKFNVRGGEVHVRVRTDGALAEVSVTDTGIGIPPDAQERVFERFFQAETAETHKYPGTGIGLSIVKDAVERHGGSIELESLPGKGTTFRVLLPASGGIKDDSGEYQKLNRWEGFLLVLADGVDADRDMERARLLADGFTVLPAYDLQKAHALVEKHKPRAVLFDVKLLEEGTGGPLFPVPSIAMVHERDPALLERILDAGAVGSVLKPFRKDEFIFLLEKALDR
ncbi:MAG: ATP-binding protein [Planctomycetota bacterium]|jgi:signal transduction histidine kinase